MSKKGAFLAAIVLSWMIIRPAWAEEESVAVRAEVSKGFITIGERVQYTVLIRRSEGVRLVSGIQFPNPRDFEVKSIQEIPEKKEGGLVISGRRFDITAYGLGEFVVDELPVRYLNAQGEEEEVRTNRLYLTVESVDKSSKPRTDIRGLKGPEALPFPWKPWVVAGGVAACGATSWLILWRLRKRREEVGAAESRLSPHEEAYQELSRLLDSSLLREGRMKEYYFRLSEIVRRYLERRYQFQAIEQTTEEIIKSMKQMMLADGIRNFVREFLEEVDMVKFAKYAPAPKEILDANRQAKEIVDRTREVEEPSQAEAKTG